jgi:hypothetical protein
MASSVVQECNFTVYKGASLDLRLCLKDSDGNPTNLSGYTVRGTVKHRYGDASGILDLNPTIVSGYCPGEYCGYVPDPVTSGYVDIDIPATGTAVLPVGQMVYDIEKNPLNNPNAVSKVLKGYFNIFPEVTNE